MERVNLDNIKTSLDDDRAIKFSAQDVNIVFGILCEGKKISSYPSDLLVSCAEFRKFAEEMSDKGTHRLKDVYEESPNIEIDGFKIAVVIFVVGHLVAPSSKNDYRVLTTRKH